MCFQICIYMYRADQKNGNTGYYEGNWFIFYFLLQIEDISITREIVWSCRRFGVEYTVKNLKLARLSTRPSYHFSGNFGRHLMLLGLQSPNHSWWSIEQKGKHLPRSTNMDENPNLTKHLFNVEEDYGIGKRKPPEPKSMQSSKNISKIQHPRLHLKLSCTKNKSTPDYPSLLMTIQNVVGCSDLTSLNHDRMMHGRK